MKLRFSLAASVLVLMLTSSAAAQTLQYIATLTGASQSPPNGSPGVGTAVVTFDFGGSIMMRVEAIFGNVTGGVTAANINAPTAMPRTGTAGIATQLPSFVEFPLGVTAGHYVHTFDMSQASTYNPAFITASGGTVAFARGALMDAIANGTAYFNLRTSTFPDGEIRGFFAFNDLRGDFNGDKTVNAADYVVWRNTLGQMGAGLPADANGDGKVDGTDYGFWKANFGHVFFESLGSGSGGVSVSAAIVPEPAAILAALLASIGLSVNTARRRR